MLNLLLNAIQAAGSNGDVAIRVKLRGENQLCIEVEDNGIGPSEEVAKRMFDPLVTTKPEGVGLGLSLVSKAAKQLGGSIEWRRENQRTLFLLQFPIPRPPSSISHSL